MALATQGLFCYVLLDRASKQDTTLGNNFCYFADEQRSGTLCEDRLLLFKTRKMQNPAERFPAAALHSKVLDVARFEVELQHCRMFRIASVDFRVSEGLGVRIVSSRATPKECLENIALRRTREVRKGDALWVCSEFRCTAKLPEIWFKKFKKIVRKHLDLFSSEHGSSWKSFL